MLEYYNIILYSGGQEVMAWYFILLIVLASLLFLHILFIIVVYNIMLYHPKFDENYALMTKEEMHTLKYKIREAEKDTIRVPYTHEYLQIGKYKMHAQFYNQGSNKSVIILHGYCARIEYRMMDMPFYYNNGFNVLMVDLRAHGESEGKYITLGALESKDTMEWIKWLSKKTKNSKIVLDGVSMGAATVLNCAGNPNLPDNVVGVIADCSFTSPYDMAKYLLWHYGKSIPYGSLYLGWLYTKWFLHYDLKKDAPIENVKHAKIPALIIHGDSDKFVPFNMSQKIYDAYAGGKSRLITKGTGHALSSVLHTKECHTAITKFLKKVIP